MLKVLLADDHRMMRDGLKAVLQRGEIQVVGEAATGHEAIALAHRLQPQVVIMDIAMPELNGLDATRRLVAELPGIKVIGLSMNADRRYVLAMFEAGAVGYLLKNSASDELIQAVRIVAGNHRYLSSAIDDVVLDEVPLSSPTTERRRASSDAHHIKLLSQREREVLQLLAEGKSSKEIATCLAVAIPTVETHRRQIMNKLNLRTIAELTKYAVREGLTSV